MILLKFIIINFNFFMLYIYFIMQYLASILFSATCFIIPFKSGEFNFSLIICSLIGSFMFLFTSFGLNVALEIFKLESFKRYRIMKKQVIAAQLNKQ